VRRIDATNVLCWPVRCRSARARLAAEENGRGQQAGIPHAADTPPWPTRCVRADLAMLPLALDAYRLAHARARRAGRTRRKQTASRRQRMPTRCCQASSSPRRPNDCAAARALLAIGRSVAGTKLRIETAPANRFSSKAEVVELLRGVMLATVTAIGGSGDGRACGGHSYATAGRDDGRVGGGLKM